MNSSILNIAGDLNSVYLTIFIILVGFYTIYKEYTRPSLGLLAIVLVFLVLRVIEPKIVLSGLSNPSIASIFLLILITAGIRKNFNTEGFVLSLFGRTTNYRYFLIRMMSTVGILSSFVNNTPIVALLSPYVYNWGKKNRIAPSKLLIPLSYATILGGMLTLIGTSTTLVLNGFLLQNGILGFNPTDLLFVGTMVFIPGILFIGIFGFRLLPKKGDTLDDLQKNPKEYVVETEITENGPLVGKSVKEAGLRNLKGIYLVEVLRGNESFAPISPDFTLQNGDTLLFAGDTQFIVELIKENKGLSYPKQVKKVYQGNIEALEAVLSNASSLPGKRIKDTDFRNRYNAAIVAVHRNGEKLTGKIGDIVLKSGDLLLLFAGKDFQNRLDLYRDVYVISKLREWAVPDKRKVFGLITIAALSLALLLLGYFPLFTSLLIIFTAMGGLKLITIQDIKREIDFDLLGTLVFSLVLGQIIIETGTGEFLAGLIMNFSNGLSLTMTLALIMLITTTLTTFISNVGSVSIMFPITYSLCSTHGYDGTPYYLGIAFAASAAFLSPIGYQTNLIIYGPGGYTFKDFLRIGAPVAAIYLTCAIMAITFLYQS
jgi:di/tricarboxylate transporter